MPSFFISTRAGERYCMFSMYAFTFRKPNSVSTFRINWFKFFSYHKAAVLLHIQAATPIPFIYLYVISGNFKTGKYYPECLRAEEFLSGPFHSSPLSKISRRIQKWAPIMILAPPQRNSPQTENAVDISANPTRDLILFCTKSCGVRIHRRKYDIKKSWINYPKMLTHEQSPKQEMDNM
jgi:hypothetical protein